jgi:hypothetical protein
VTKQNTVAIAATELKANIHFNFIWSTGPPETCPIMLNPERELHCIALELAAVARAGHVCRGLEGNEGGDRKQGNIEHTVVPNVAFLNGVFSVHMNCLLRNNQL